MRMRLMLPLVALLLVTLTGCHSTKSGEGEGGAANANKESNEPETNKEPESNTDEIKGGEDEFCLLPPEAQDDELAGKIKVGQEAPDFTLTDSLTGEEFKFADYKGKTIFLFFWASWCPYCKMAFRPKGSINKFVAELEAMEGPNLVLIGIGTGTDDTEDAQKAFMKTNGVTFPTTHDGNLAVEKAYGVLGMPTCVVIGREGKILTYGSYRHSDYSDKLLEYLRQECVQKQEGE